MSMHSKQEPRHLIDLLFPVALLFVFALSAIAVILLATGIYKDTAEHSSRSYTARTALAYLTEKVHQNDSEGSIDLTDFDGCEALRIRQTYEDLSYTTYIYVYEGTLRELFLKDGTEASAADGNVLLSVRELHFSDLGDGLLSFSCTDSEGHEATTLVRVRSAEPLSKGDLGS